MPNLFLVLLVGASAAAVIFPPPALAQPAPMTLEICPDNFGSFPEDAPPLRCGCNPEATARGLVIGTNPYDYVSGLCRSARHAGAIGTAGGLITVSPAKAPFFPAVTQNGLSSQSGSGGNGFVVEGTGSASAAPSAQAITSLDVCPDNYGSFPEDAPALTCGCSPEATARGLVIGTNPYDYVSSLCRAALHAGAVGRQGGVISVSPVKAPFFPAVTRNGVSSQSGSGDHGFQVAVPAPLKTTAASAPASDSAGRPIQAPIAATLRAVGKVQVYINFATGSDRIEGSSGPILSELLATLSSDPAMKIQLVGHTDTQGNAPYNLDLSQRRAASVYGWLSTRGIARDRLRSSGRGFLEPIADNDSERGRALNRRVEVKLFD